MSIILEPQMAVTLQSVSESHLFADAQFKQQKIFASVQARQIRRPSSTRETNKPASIDEGDFADTEIQLEEGTKATQNALLITQNRLYCLVDDFPAPQELEPNEVVIRNQAAGLNHIDWKSVDYDFCLPQLPWVTGREMAGVVERVGSAVVKFRPGDCVWTSTYYKDRRAGCFQDLVVVPQHTIFQIPSKLDFHTSACLGVAGLTAAMSLWRWLQLPMPDANQEARADGRLKLANDVLLIWGGSTATGQFAIQIAAHTGVDIIAVCSESTAGLVSSLGATHVITYTGKTDFHVIGEILCVAQGRLTKAIDLVGPKTAKLVLKVIAACGSPQVDFAPLAFMSNKETIPANAKVHNVEMKQFVLDSTSEIYGQRLNELVDAGLVRPPRIRILPGGLAAVEAGLQLVKEGSLRGDKLVVSFTQAGPHDT